MNGKNSETASEKRTLKILFWCFAPIIFPVFLRLFWILFQFVYGTILFLVLGKEYESAIAFFAFLTALVFSIAAFRYIYLQFKQHIINE